MDDQVINAAMARGLHTDVCRDHALAGWVVMRDPPEYLDRFIAKLVIDKPTPYVLVADSLVPRINEARHMASAGRVADPQHFSQLGRDSRSTDSGY
jgi:hypothetical protein